MAEANRSFFSRKREPAAPDAKFSDAQSESSSTNLGGLTLETLQVQLWGITADKALAESLPS